MTLFQYIDHEYQRGVIDHSVRVTREADGRYKVLIHPDGRDGSTVIFELTRSMLVESGNTKFQELLESVFPPKQEGPVT